MINYISSLWATVTPDILELFSKPANMLDILLIALIAYAFIKVILETQSLPIIISIFIIFFIYGFSVLFNLPLTRLIIQSIISILVIILAIVFQTELRRIFSFVNLFGLIKKEKPLSTSVNSILAKTVFLMARLKVGALIVLPGRESIEPNISGGYRLDGCISEAILLSIFDKHSPGHDGAIIINDDKISHFGTHLPLAEKYKSLNDIGTRHRAAIGLSERSDSLTIVVSEEKGIVSLARKGELKPIYDATSLEKEINMYLGRRFPLNYLSHLLNQFMKNVSLVMIALLLAMGFWLLNSQTSPTVQKNISVPLEFKNIIADHIVGEAVPAIVVISLEGRSADFSQFSNKNDIKIVLDLSGLEGGTHQVIVDKVSVRYPPNLNLVKIDPQNIRVKIQSKPVLESKSENK